MALPNNNRTIGRSNRRNADTTAGRGANSGDAAPSPFSVGRLSVSTAAFLLRKHVPAPVHAWEIFPQCIPRRKHDSERPGSFHARALRQREPNPDELLDFAKESAEASPSPCVTADPPERRTFKRRGDGAKIATGRQGTGHAARKQTQSPPYFSGGRASSVHRQDFRCAVADLQCTISPAAMQALQYRCPVQRIGDALIVLACACGTSEQVPRRAFWREMLRAIPPGKPPSRPQGTCSDVS